MPRAFFCIALLLQLAPTNAFAGESAPIEPGPDALKNWLLARIDAADKVRAGAVAAIRTPEALKARQAELRKAFLSAIGGFPERTALHPVVVGTILRDGYKVEKILFESRPGFHVTAALFLPDAIRFPPPWPGVVIACGHSVNGKAMEAYQRGSALTALHGMAALIFDPIEQGERGRGSTRGHNAIGLPALLLGTNTAQIEIWDGMRAIDYLQSRPDIIKDKIGFMGNSGGGTQTAYMMALEDRIKAAAPACYITTLPRVARAIGPQDAEQNIFGQLKFGMDHPDYLTMRAPSPALVAAAIQDFFPIAGARAAVEEAGGMYSILGKPDQIAKVEHDDKHGWAKPMREASVRWMGRWLRGVDAQVTEADSIKLIDEREMQATRTGHVSELAGERTAVEVLRDRLRTARPAPVGELPLVVRQAAGIRTEVLVTTRGDFSSPAAGKTARVLLDREGMPLPGLVLAPKKPAAKPPVLLVHSDGKEKARALAETFSAEGRVVLNLDLRGHGETMNRLNNFYGDSDGSDSYLAYLLGESLVGQRAEDLLAAAAWLESKGGGKPDLVAAGWTTTPALHAAVAVPGAFGKVSLREAPRDWSEVVQGALPHRYSDVVHGGLMRYTLADLKKALADRLVP